MIMDSAKKRLAIERLQFLGYSQEVIDSFDKDGEITKDVDGEVVSLSAEEKMLIDKVIEENHIFVFHIIETPSYQGTYHFYNLLIINRNIDDAMRTFAVRGDKFCNYCYVHNVDVPRFSDFGTVAFIKDRNGFYRADA